MKRRAFTLIEVMTVVIIIGILYSITSYVYGVALARSRDHQRLGDLDTINNALEQYHLDTHAYPKVGPTNSNIFVAKFQLEQFGCNYGVAGKTFLAPVYLTTIPEDPQYKLNLSGSGDTCQTNQFGQYLYVGVTSDPAINPQSFYLMARTERTDNMSVSTPTQADLGYYGSILYSQGTTFQLCNKTNFQSACTHSYYKKSAVNQ